MNAPKLFISYSWSDAQHEQWVLNLATELCESGVDVILDKWDLKEGCDVNVFMEQMVNDPGIQKVVMICNKKYVEKANSRTGGVGIETQIISQEIYSRQDQQKFVAIVVQKDKDGTPFLPTYYKSRMYIDLCHGERYEENYRRLLKWIFDEPFCVKPELGKKSFSIDHDKSYVLADFNGHLLDGFVFCAMVYKLWEDIRKSVDGVERIRLRKNQLEKQLIEKLTPISRYIKAHYGEGRQLSVKWISCSQKYDAELFASGFLVEHGYFPASYFVKVTTAVHKNDHILRKLLHENGGGFTVKGIKRNSKTTKYVSEPYIYCNDEHVIDLANQIIERIKAKNQKTCPDNTVLIIQCFTDTLIYDDEWEDAIRRVKEEKIKCRFKEIFIFDSNHRYTSTIYCHQENNTSL
jgi:hypothetical protein